MKAAGNCAKELNGRKTIKTDAHVIKQVFFCFNLQFKQSQTIAEFTTVSQFQSENDIVALISIFISTLLGLTCTRVNFLRICWHIVLLCCYRENNLIFR